MKSVTDKIPTPSNISDCVWAKTVATSSEVLRMELKTNKDMYFALVSSIYSAIHESKSGITEKELARQIADRIIGTEE